MKIFKVYSTNNIIQVNSKCDIYDYCQKYYNVQSFQVTFNKAMNVEDKEFNLNETVYNVVLTNKLGESFAYIGLTNLIIE